MVRSPNIFVNEQLNCGNQGITGVCDAASPDNTLIPASTPGTTGKSDASDRDMSRTGNIAPLKKPQIRTFTERHFKNLFWKLYQQEMSKLHHWNQEITVLFTYGKGKIWSSLNVRNPRGMVSDAFLDHERKLMVGAALIDIEKIAKDETMMSASVVSSFISTYGLSTVLSPSGGGPLYIQFGSRSLSLSKLRYEVLHVLAHEFLHFIQLWNVGDSEAAHKNYMRIWLKIREQAEEQHPDWDDDMLSAAAHARHPSEQEAERLSGVRLSKYRMEIERGDWDQYLPIRDLGWYVNR